MIHTEKLTLKRIHVDGSEIVFQYVVDTHLFSTKIYYADVNFDVLERKYGKNFIDKLLFHTAFFEGMKYCSLFPHLYDVSAYSQYVNPDLIELFSCLYKNIFAQHRWENNAPKYKGPQIIFQDSLYDEEVAEVHSGAVEMLFSCGGGKDSLAAMKLLERSDIQYSVSQYSHSIYGRHQSQHDLIDRLVTCCSPQAHHRFYVFDDFLDSPVLDIHYQKSITSLCAPETPCGVFETLPLMLANGYTSLCVGHERDADVGSFFWKEAQQEVNHQ